MHLLSEFRITINGKLKESTDRSLLVRLTFLNVDERIRLPPEYGASNSTQKVLGAGLMWKTFPLDIRYARRAQVKAKALLKHDFD